MLDILLIAALAGYEPSTPPPFEVSGLRLEPSVLTLCAQVTGDGATSLYIRTTEGRVRCVDSTTDFASAERTIAVSSGHAYQVNDAGQKLASGYAVWMTAVAVQHRPTGSVGIVFVPGAVTVVASAVVATQDEIASWLQSDDSTNTVRYVILGDALFYRSADTTITVRISEKRRPAYVEESAKTGVTFAQDSNTDLSSEFCCFIDIPVELISTSAVADNGTYIDGIVLPNLPFGGYVKDWGYFPTKAGTNAGATNTFRLAIDGTNMTGNDITVTLALSAIGQVVQGDGSFTSNTNVFKSGDKLDVEVVSSATDFTAGQGFFHVEIWKYVK